MSLETFVQAMPKVDVHIQLEGAISNELLKMIAEQTDIASQYKRRRDFVGWMNKLDEPDYQKLDQLARETAAWVRYPDDIARMVYNLGVALHKQNVRYAEVAVIPSLYTDIGISYQDLLAALNDGRDRVSRAWNVRMDWLMAMPRERPRKSDEVARWATNSYSQKGNVVGLALVGNEQEQPIAQFKKAFATAEKKVLPRVTHLHSFDDVSAQYIDVLEVASPERVTDCWNVLDDGNFLSLLVERDLPVVVTPKREVLLERIETLAAYPFRDLLDSQVNLVLGSGMPELYKANLNDAYLAAVQTGQVTVDELEMIAINGVRATLLTTVEKHAMIEEFQEAYATLREEHLAEVEEVE